MALNDDNDDHNNRKTLESSSSWSSVSCSSWYNTNATEIQDQLETATRAIGSGLVAGTVVWMVLTVLLVPAGTTAWRMTSDYLRLSNRMSLSLGIASVLVSCCCVWLWIWEEKNDTGIPLNRMDFCG